MTDQPADINLSESLPITANSDARNGISTNSLPGREIPPQFSHRNEFIISTWNPIPVPISSWVRSASPVSPIEGWGSFIYLLDLYLFSPTKNWEEQARWKQSSHIFTYQYQNMRKFYLSAKFNTFKQKVGTVGQPQPRLVHLMCYWMSKIGSGVPIIGPV